MTKKEYLESVKTCEINSERVEAIEKLYKVSIKGLIASVISYAGTVDFFDEERRALSFEEMVNADKINGTSFVKNKMLPMIDAYDNDYIVYDFNEEKWGKVNLADMLLFKKRDSLDEVL